MDALLSQAYGGKEEGFDGVDSKLRPAAELPPMLNIATAASSSMTAGLEAVDIERDIACCAMVGLAVEKS